MISGSNLLEYVVRFPESCNIILPHGIENILWKGGVICILVNMIDYGPNHVSFRRSYRSLSNRRYSGEIRVNPHFNSSLLVDAYHVFINIEISHFIIELSKSSEGLVVEMKYIWVWDLVNVA